MTSKLRPLFAVKTPDGRLRVVKVQENLEPDRTQSWGRFFSEKILGVPHDKDKLSVTRIRKGRPVIVYTGSLAPNTFTFVDRAPWLIGAGAAGAAGAAAAAGALAVGGLLATGLLIKKSWSTKSRAEKPAAQNRPIFYSEYHGGRAISTKNKSVAPGSPIVWHALLHPCVGMWDTHDDGSVMQNMHDLCKGLDPDISAVFGTESSSISVRDLGKQGYVLQDMSQKIQVYVHFIQEDKSSFWQASAFKTERNNKITDTRGLNDAEYKGFKLAAIKDSDPLSLLRKIRVDKNGYLVGVGHRAKFCGLFLLVVAYILALDPSHVSSWDRSFREKLKNSIAEAAWYDVGARNVAQLMARVYNVDIGISRPLPITDIVRPSKRESAFEKKRATNRQKFLLAVQFFDETLDTASFLEMAKLSQGMDVGSFVVWDRMFKIRENQRLDLFVEAILHVQIEPGYYLRIFYLHALIVFVKSFDFNTPEKPARLNPGLVPCSEKVQKFLCKYAGYASTSTVTNENSQRMPNTTDFHITVDETYYLELSEKHNVEYLCAMMNIVYNRGQVEDGRINVSGHIKEPQSSSYGEALMVDTECAERLPVEQDVEKVFAKPCLTNNGTMITLAKKILLVPFDPDHEGLDLIQESHQKAMTAGWNPATIHQLAECSINAFANAAGFLIRGLGITPENQYPEVAHDIFTAISRRQDQNHSWVILASLWASGHFEAEKVNALLSTKLENEQADILSQWAASFGSRELSQCIDQAEPYKSRGWDASNAESCSTWIFRLFREQWCSVTEAGLTIELGHATAQFLTSDSSANVAGVQYKVLQKIPDILLPWTLIRGCLLLVREGDLFLFFWHSTEIATWGRTFCDFRDDLLSGPTLNPNMYVFPMTPMGPVLGRGTPGFAVFMRTLFRSGVSSLAERYINFYDASWELRSANRKVIKRQPLSPEDLEFFKYTYAEHFISKRNNFKVRAFVSDNLWTRVQELLPKFTEGHGDPLNDFTKEKAHPRDEDFKKNVEGALDSVYELVWEQSKFHIGSLHALVSFDNSVLGHLLTVVYLSVILKNVFGNDDKKQWTRLDLMKVSEQVVRRPDEERPLADAFLEVATGMLLRKGQVSFVDGLGKSQEKVVHELLMGMGKSRMIIPLFVARAVFHRRKSVIVVQPKHLLRAALGNVEASIMSWVSPEVARLNVDLCAEDAQFPSITVVTDELFKVSLLEKPDQNLSGATVLFDEVDFMYTPSRSELNIPDHASYVFHPMAQPFTESESAMDAVERGEDLYDPNKRTLEHIWFKDAYVKYLLAYFDDPEQEFLQEPPVFPQRFEDYLSQIRAQCAAMKMGERYGSHPTSVWALPFVAANSPLLGSMFSNADLLAHLTCLVKKKDGLNPADRRKLAILKFQGHESSEAVVEGSDNEVRAYLEFVLLPDMKVAMRRRNISFIDLMAFTPKAIGFSGTHLIEPPTELTWAKDIKPDNLGNALIDRLMNSARVVLWKDWAEIAIINPACIIDEAAMLVHNFILQEDFMQVWSQHNEGQEIVYVDSDHVTRVWPGRGRLEGPVGNRKVFFDQAHTVGVDLVLEQNANAIVLIKEQSTFSSVAQAMFRMRGLQDGQTVEFRVFGMEQVPVEGTLASVLREKDKAFLQESEARRSLQIAKAKERLKTHVFQEEVALAYKATADIEVQKDVNVQTETSVATVLPGDIWKRDVCAHRWFFDDVRIQVSATFVDQLLKPRSGAAPGSAPTFRYLVQEKNRILVGRTWELLGEPGGENFQFFPTRQNEKSIFAAIMCGCKVSVRRQLELIESDFGETMRKIAGLIADGFPHAHIVTQFLKTNVRFAEFKKKYPALFSRYQLRTRVITWNSMEIQVKVNA